MNVLMITGDRAFMSGHPRYDLQRAAVDDLQAVYWGRGALWPRIPAGRFDVVTTQDPFWRGLLGWGVARLKGARLNVQVHGDIEASKKYFTSVLRRADSIRVVSEKIKKQVEKIGVHASITVLPVYVDILKFHSVVRREHSSKNILWIGRFEEEKNPLGAIQVLKEVLKNEPAARLVMLGQGSMGQQLSDNAANLPIIVPGWQNPLIFLDTADVVLCTSWHESWGAAMVEALAAGVPVVAPDVGIAKEAGATVVPREQLAEAVVELLKNGSNGELKLQLLSKEEWVQKWRESLAV